VKDREGKKKEAKEIGMQQFARCHRS